MIRFVIFAVVFFLPARLWAQMPPTTVFVSEVMGKEIQQQHRVIGSLRAISRSDVAALEEGRINQITVREGVNVQQGEVIALIDDRRLNAQMEEAKSSRDASLAVVDERVAELNLKRKELERTAMLVARNVITSQEQDEVNANVKIAEARLESAKREVARQDRLIEYLDIRLQDMTVKAPFDAFVVSRHAEPGEWIKPGEPLVTITSRGKIDAWLNVPERFTNRLDPSVVSQVRVEVIATGKTFFSNSIKRIADVHPQTRMLQFAVEIPNDDDTLVPGMSVVAWIPVGEMKAHQIIPKNAVIMGQDSAYVYQVIKDDKGQDLAQRVDIKPLFEMDKTVVVDAENLPIGSSVIVEGNERLMPGSPVIALPAHQRVTLEGTP